MSRIRLIILPTDFSEFAAEAIPYACALAEKYDAALHVLHVIQDVSYELPDFGMGLAVPAFRDNFEDRKDQLEAAAISGLAKALPPGWEKGRHVVLATRFGRPFVEIVKYARDHAADMIVIGTHGRSGIAQALMGSVAERVVRTAGCPVLSVRPGQHRFVPPLETESASTHSRKPKPVIRRAIEKLYGPCPEDDFPAANAWANGIDWECVKEEVESKHPGFTWHKKQLDADAAAEELIHDVRGEMLHARGTRE